MEPNSVRLVGPAPPAKSPMDLSAHDLAMVRLGQGASCLRSHSKPEHPTSEMGAVAIEADRRALQPPRMVTRISEEAVTPEPASEPSPGKKLFFLRNFSVLEEDVVICNRVRCGVDPAWFRHRNDGDHRYLRALAFEEARVAATRRRRSLSSAVVRPKTPPSFNVDANRPELPATDSPVPDSLSGGSSTSTGSSNSNSNSNDSGDVASVTGGKPPVLKQENAAGLPRRGLAPPATGKRSTAPRKGAMAPNARLRTASESSALLTPREKAMHSRYLIRESFAAGAYGKVCGGQDKTSRQEIAVKIVPKHILISPEEKQSVVREEVIHKSLNHPNIVKLLDVFEDEGAHYFILERADSGSLNAIISGAGIEESKCREFFRQLLLALEYLHRNNIVHHDIKPHNVLLDEAGKSVKLCDFGASRAFNADQTSLPFAGIFGTPGYIAPELLDGKKAYGPAIDMFSAGVMLFEMVFGYGPFYPPSACTYQELEFPLRPKVSEQLKQLLTRLLERDPAQRITASQALGHPWITLKSGGRSAPNSPVASPVSTSAVTPPKCPRW